MKKISLLALCLVLSGCLVGPNYRPPEICVDDGWHSPEDCDVISAPPQVAWWEIFDDPLLNRYIHMGALCNKEILAAEAVICEARALRKIAASSLFPQISADLNATRTYFSKNGPVFAISPGEEGASPVTGLPFQLQIPQIQNLYTILFDASWEIDLFGKTRRSVEAANANIGSAIEQRNDVLISILGEIAISYIELRSLQTRGLLVEEFIALLEKSTEVTAKRFQTGYSNKLDLERLEAELAQAKADLPDIYAKIFQNIYALSVLTGNAPETLMAELLPFQPLPRLPEQVAVGIRSDVIRRRPDVRGAERNLAAATANIGVAVASFFPTFTLVGDIGLQSIRLNNLFQAKSLTWAIGGNLGVPIYQGGSLVGNLQLSQAEAIAACFIYQQTVLRALQETESALVAYTQELRVAGQLQQAADKYDAVVLITMERFTKGLVNITDLLDVQRQWNLSKQNLLSSETAALTDVIALYKALGGGWEPQ